MTSLDELKAMVGKTVTEIQYESGSDTAYIIYGSGYGLEVSVEPEYEEGEE